MWILKMLILIFNLNFQLNIIIIKFITYYTITFKYHIINNLALNYSNSMNFLCHGIVKLFHKIIIPNKTYKLLVKIYFKFGTL